MTDLTIKPVSRQIDYISTILPLLPGDVRFAGQVVHRRHYSPERVKHYPLNRVR